MLNTYSKRAAKIITKHYEDNGLLDYINNNDEELGLFWWEASKEDVNEWVHDMEFANWAEMKRSKHVSKVWNTGKNRVLIFADFDALSFS